MLQVLAAMYVARPFRGPHSESITTLESVQAAGEARTEVHQVCPHPLSYLRSTVYSTYNDIFMTNSYKYYVYLLGLFLHESIHIVTWTLTFVPRI